MEFFYRKSNHRIINKLHLMLFRRVNINNIITISRQFGSGGREVGKRLADALHCVYYNKELLNAIVKETGLAETSINLYDEHSTRIFGYTFSRTFATFQQSPSDKVQLAYTKIIKEVGKAGNAIIVGRCSDYILREQKPFKGFIYASDMSFRINRCYAKVSEDIGVKDKKQMMKEILNVDKERAKYYEYYTSFQHKTIENYNLCIDTSVIGVKQAVDVILAALNSKETN